MVHLKRFFFTRLRRDKLDVKVEFPLENWDLSAYLPPHQVCHLRVCMPCPAMWSCVLMLHTLMLNTCACRGAVFSGKGILYMQTFDLQQLLYLHCSMAMQSSSHGWLLAVFPVNRLS